MRPKRARTGFALLAAGLVFATWSSAGASSKPNSEQPISGGVATFAEGPGATPNFIFPMMPLSDFSVANSEQFQFLMYRPLYFFGASTGPGLIGQPTLNEPLSLADYPPKFSDHSTVVTMTMKNYVWSNGERVDAQDVVFWMNLVKVEKLIWAGYVPGTIPDDVKTITTPNSKTVVFKLNGAVNPYWWVYNELSQITPLPMAWDVSAAGQKAGSQLCGKASYQSVATSDVNGKVIAKNAAARNCEAVFNYLSTESGFNPQNPKGSVNVFDTYAKNPLWQVVDGPWHLVKFSNGGDIVFKPNPHYSGPIKPKLAEFEELPFTSDTPEYNALLAGQVDYGYLPPQDITKNAKGTTTPGPNNPRLAGRFNLFDEVLWQINYFPMNMTSTDDGGQAGKIMQQTYFRQVFQEFVDQPAIIKKIYKGYGYPTYGPVPVYPKNPFATKFEESNPYPYNPTKAIATLKAHGWTIKPGGTDVCNDASKCGVPKGTRLALNLQYASGILSLAEEMADEISAWRAAGIDVTGSQATFDTVTGNALPCSGKNCTWDMENWGGGWVFSPDYYPTGEDLLETGAISNSGSYSNPTNDSMIKSTDFTTASLGAWENYATVQTPLVWQPVPITATEIVKNLKGVTPINSLASITPENWYFVR
jgi:peptide/nickel transport system substrate-binding protein